MQSKATEIIPIHWNHDTESVFIIDQTLLPYELKWVEIKNYEEMADAIENMRLRGAPLIGIAAAYGLVLALKEALLKLLDRNLLKNFLKKASVKLHSTRPTAVNLAWALETMEQIINSHSGQAETLYEILLDKALWIQKDDYDRCKSMSEHALKLIQKDLALKIKEKGKLNILTHCNAGALATGGYGTALGLIRSLNAEGLLGMAYSDETRPRQQGSRLTVWELSQEGIPVTMICDTMAGSLMQQGLIDAVVVGSDRITANGDVANKIGTYQVAILAKYHGLPFYVLAPETTVDMNLKTGEEIEIEYRNSEELSHINDKACAPLENVSFFNPGFDVTPNHLVSRIITENGLKTFKVESLEKTQDSVLN